MSSAWYFDAQDMRAGRGFVTFRNADLDEALVLTEGTYFIGPPSFVPEFVSSRAVAFSAARGSFELGLLDADDREIAFPTLSAAADFLRRGYFRGSGGDGPPAGPGGGPPPSSSPSPEYPLFEERWDSLLSEATRAAQKYGGGLTTELNLFARAVENTASGEAKAFQWTFHSPGGEASAEAYMADRVALAAIRIAVELVRRYPTAKSDPIWAPQAANTLSRFGRAVVRGGLGHAFTNLASAMPGLSDWLENIWAGLLGSARPGPRGAALLLPWLLLGGSSDGIGDDYGFNIFQQSPLRADLFFLEPVEDDPIDLLERLPVPDALADKLSRSDTKGEATLYHFLFSVLASPTLLDLPTQDTLEIDFLLLATVLITQPALENLQPPLNFKSNTAMRAAVALSAARDWLAANLPEFAFSSDVEKMLAGPIVGQATA